MLLTVSKGKIYTNVEKNSEYLSLQYLLLFAYSSVWLDMVNIYFRRKDRVSDGKEMQMPRYT